MFQAAFLNVKEPRMNYFYLNYGWLIFKRLKRRRNFYRIQKIYMSMFWMSWKRLLTSVYKEDMCFKMRRQALGEMLNCFKKMWYELKCAVRMMWQTLLKESDAQEKDYVWQVLIFQYFCWWDLFISKGNLNSSVIIKTFPGRALTVDLAVSLFKIKLFAEIRKPSWQIL